MDGQFSVGLKELIDQFKLEVVHGASNIDEIEIITTDVNRPGLPLSGFYQHFEPKRVQIIGRVETTYLENVTAAQRRISLDKFFGSTMPAVVVTRGLDVFPEMLESAIKYNITILRTKESTSSFMSSIINYLSLCLAPRITCHGVLVEVYGEGILLLGESGVGKSETAVELINRGHRLVADDAVEIKRVSEKTLVGTAPEIIRHFIEIRGVGIVDVKELFGMGAVKTTEKIDLVINLEVWKEKKEYDRLGISEEHTELLGLLIPSLTIPVKPGRNLAIIVEVAAMNNRQKKMGYNAAEALNKKLMDKMGVVDE